jgi:TolA-binding protein
MCARVLTIVAILLLQVLPDSGLGAGQSPAPSTATPDRAQDQLDFANGLYQRKLFLEAAEQYGTFIRSYPNHEKIPTALFRRAECLYQASYQNESSRNEILKDAEQELRTLLERFPQNERRTEALLRRGEILCQLARPAEAAPLLEELLRGPLSETVEEAVRFYLAQAYWDQKKTTEAEKQWETLRLRFPKGERYAPATYSLAILKQQKSQPEAAMALLKELTAEKPRFPVPKDSPIPGDARMVLAEIYRQLGDHTRAAAMFLEASREPRHRIGALFGQAWELFQQGEFEPTISLCRTLLKEPGLGDREAGTLFLLGSSLYETKKYQEAIDPLRRAVVHPGAGNLQIPAWFRLVWSLFLTNDHDGASREAEALLKLKLDPALAGDIHFVLAQIAAASKRYPDAATEYRTVIEQFPASRFVEKAAYGIGDTQYRTGAYREAAQAFANFLETYPKSPLYDQALRWLAESLLQAGEYKEAAGRITQLIERNPSHEDLPHLLYRQGLALNKSGQTEEMRRSFSELLERFPTSSEAPEALYWLAWQDDQAGNRERSLQEYERLVKEYPKAERWNAARRRLVVGYMETNHFDRALPILLEMLADKDQAKEMGPEIFFRSAIYASEQGRHDDALRILNRVAEVHTRPEVLERAFIERGREFIILSRWQEASDCANEFFDKFPHSPFQPEAYWIRARALQGENHFDDAARAFDQSLQALANMGSSDLFFEATLHLDRGRLMEVRGQPEEALKEYLYVDILFPDPRTSPSALLRGSIIQEQLGKKNEARQMLERLAKMYPDAPEARQAQERLKLLGK